MELKKEFLGSRIFIKTLGREVLICEENKGTLIQQNCYELFVIKRNDKAVAINNPNDKRRIKANNRKS